MKITVKRLHEEMNRRERWHVFSYICIAISLGALTWQGCTIQKELNSPSPPKMEYDEEGRLIIPDIQTIKLVWDPTGYRVEAVDVQIFSGNIVQKEFRTMAAIPANVKEPYILLYDKLKELPPGTYKVRIRLHSPEANKASPWSDTFDFRKDWE